MTASEWKAYIAAPEAKYRPDLRWWLAEGLNTDKTLVKNVREIFDSGFGAAEFLAMPEPSADSSIYGWGSREWTSDTQLIVKETTRLGLGFSLTSGAHWANANLPDTYIWQGAPYNPDNKAAAQELDYGTALLAPGERFCGALPLPVPVSTRIDDFHGHAATYTRHHFEGVVAARMVTPRENCGQAFGGAQGDGTGIIDVDSLLDLSAYVTGEAESRVLDWTAPSDGSYVLLAYWMHGTGQTATPSVSTNYTVNYVDTYGIDALIDYWEAVVLTDDLRQTIRSNGRGEIYMDSLELLTIGAGGVYWGLHLREEFQKRKGYDILLYMPLITMDGVRVTSEQPKRYDYTARDEAGKALAARVQADLYGVLSSLYVENVLQPLSAWLHSLGMTLRAEPSYGMPYEISTPAQYIDGIETESFAQVADLDLYRAILGSANMYNRVFSSETGAVHERNYCYNMDDWTQLCFLQFAGGVNRTVFHGYSAIEGSVGDTQWPGHEGMYACFSERFNSRQPASLHYPLWTRMLARYQKLLRHGLPARDIAVLRTDYKFINYGQPKGRNTFETSPFMHDEPTYFRDLSLQRAGYTYDYFAPQLLLDEQNASWTATALQPHGPAYRAIMLYQEALSVLEAQKLLSIAKGGLPIVFVNNNAELLTYDGTEVYHKQAASVGRGLCDDDAVLQNIVAEIKSLPNTRTAENPADALDALRSLGITPRAGFDAPNDRIITCSRRDENGLLCTFAYNYKFREDIPCAFTLCLEGEYTPALANGWSGEISALPGYTVQNGRTCIPLTLLPGEAAMIVSCGAAPGPCAVTAANRTVSLDRWDIEIEDWNEGERVINTEERFGHTTEEAYYTTRKTKLRFPNSLLLPWKDLPATREQLSALAGDAPVMAHVSGIGTYTAVFDWPYETQSAVLALEAAGGGTVVAWINGACAGLVNTRTLRMDIGQWLASGRNEIRLEVASTLTNRMIQRGYRNQDSGWTDDFPSVQAYGLTGVVQIGRASCRERV